MQTLNQIVHCPSLSKWKITLCCHLKHVRSDKWQPTTRYNISAVCYDLKLIQDCLFGYQQTQQCGSSRKSEVLPGGFHCQHQLIFSNTWSHTRYASFIWCHDLRNSHPTWLFCLCPHLTVDTFCRPTQIGCYTFGYLDSGECSNSHMHRHTRTHSMWQFMCVRVCVYAFILWINFF